MKTLCCTSAGRVSAVDNFPTRWCTSTLGFKCSSVFGCKISKQVDCERRSDTLATRSPDITPMTSFLWGYVKDKLFSTPVPDIANLKARITRFCYSNWRHVGEHVERNLLSIRRSPCNERGTCWSVLMCCKKTSWDIFCTWNTNIYFYSTHSSFLVINVCNQGKNLCSPVLTIPPETPCIRTQSVPRSKHSPPRLYKTSLLMLCKAKFFFWDPYKT